jgi:hypothetical protein
MNERPRKATRLTVSLEEQDYRTLNEIALARDASVSWVIRQAIRQFIDTVAVFEHDVADIDADPEEHLSPVRLTGVRTCKRLLDLDRTMNRVKHAREFCEHTIAGGK